MSCQPAVRLIILSYFALNLSCCDGKKELWLGAFLTVNISDGGWRSAGILPALQMAVEDVNNRSDILRDYTLKMSWRDTRVSVLNSILTEN